MPEVSKTPEFVRFDPFELSVETGELFKNGIRVRLSGQPIQVLIRLVATPGKLVTREELQQLLWAGNSYGDFEAGLNTAVNRLRVHLSDSATEPKYIETVPARGYRFIGKLTSPTAGTDSDKTVSHYRILGAIGSGGMGIVYKAQDLKLGRHVALKFLPDELAANHEALERFRREASTASSLNHPNICTIYEVEEHQGQPFIVMELLEGETLRECLASAVSRRRLREPVLEIGFFLGIAIQIADGLQAAHTKGVIHRDIKPTNIFITVTHLVKILDFGLAKLIVAADQNDIETICEGSVHESSQLQAGLSDIGAIIGTAGYMSPEQARGEEVDARSDLFSFGTILYEMGTGQPAFHGTNTTELCQAVRTRTPIAMHEFDPTFPSALEGVVNTALNKNRRLRYQSATDLRRDLTQFQQSLANRVTPPFKSPRTEIQTCVLVVAVPRASIVEHAFEVSVWVRHQSLEERCDAQSAKSRLSTPTLVFYERTFDLESTVNESGKPLAADVALRLDSPNFEPSPQVKKVSVPPDSDSSGYTFLIKPRLTGTLVANLELVDASDKVVASRSFCTGAVFQKDADWTAGFALTFPLLKSTYEALRHKSQDRLNAETPIIERQTRVLEAAAPKEAKVGCSIEVMAMVRESASAGGLRELLRAEGAPKLTEDDVRERPFLVEFPLDDQAKPQPLDIALRLESPGFEPPRQVKKLKVPPNGDSPTCTFLIVPRVIGEHVINLELLDIQTQILASRSIRIHALSSGAEISSGKVFVTIPLVVVIQGDTSDAAKAATSAAEVGVLDQPLEGGLRSSGESYTDEFLREVNATGQGTERIESPGLGKNLDTMAGQSSLRAASPVEPASAPHKPHRSRRLLFISMGFVAVLLSGITFQLLHWHTASRGMGGSTMFARHIGYTVVLSEFINSTGDSAYDRLTPAVQTSVSNAPTDLSHVNVSSPSVKFLSSDQVTEMLLQMNEKLDEPLTPSLARELCLRAKANAVVTGSISAAGTHYKITATAINCQTRETLGTAEGEAEKLVGGPTDVRRAFVSRAMGDVVDQLLQKVLKPGGGAGGTPPPK